MNEHALKERLPRTWGAFFGRYGTFTPAQKAAIPVILAGHNLVLCTGTASGKTEAVLAPLIEQHFPPVRPTVLTMLYLLPTRALINDLAGRLTAPLDRLRVSYSVKTRDLNTFDPKHPADLLLTTPESLDALLTSEAKALSEIRAVVIDELHIFDSTVRGDQLRVLLNRLRQVRAHAARIGDAADEHIQYAALSATLAQPEESAGRYFPDVQVVQLPSQRAIHVEEIALDSESADALIDFLHTFRQRGWRKGLVFCNTRAEVEAYAAAVRAADSPFGDAVYVHYSNLERERRHEIESQFSHAEAALCFASSTLELGIDIGSIDAALLIGPPGNAAAFTQRIGRANRRQQETRAICFYRTGLEKIMFDALMHTPDKVPMSSFRPSIAIQQIFSLLKQSPTGAVRLNPLAELFSGLLSRSDLQAILGQLQSLGYLSAGRSGEWRAGERLNRLSDLQAFERTPLSLYSNLQTNDSDSIKIRDKLTQRVVATVNRQWFERDLLTLEGRPVNVEWFDGEALWVSVHHGETRALPLHYRSTRQMLNYELAQQIPLEIGLLPDEAPLMMAHEGWLWFHWLGDLYGYALLDLLRYTLPAEVTAQPGVCLLLPDELRTLPHWSSEQVKRYLHDNYRRYESLLAVGAYHHLLPTDLRRNTVIEQFDVPRFIQRVSALSVSHAPESLTESLRTLIEPLAISH